MPIVTRSVSAASRARPIIASGLGLRDATCPPTHSESIGSSFSSRDRLASAARDEPDAQIVRRAGLIAALLRVSAISAGDRPSRPCEHVGGVLAHQRPVPRDRAVQVGEEPRRPHHACRPDLGVVHLDEDAAMLQVRIGGQHLEGHHRERRDAGSLQRLERLGGRSARVQAVIAASISRRERVAVRRRRGRPPNRFAR